MINNHRIQPSPPLERQPNRLRRNAWIRYIAREHLDALRAVLVVQLIKRRVRARDENELVRVREEVVCCCEADSWIGNEA